MKHVSKDRKVKEIILKRDVSVKIRFDSVNLHPALLRQFLDSGECRGECVQRIHRGTGADSVNNPEGVVSRPGAKVAPSEGKTDADEASAQAAP